MQMEVAQVASSTSAKETKKTVGGSPWLAGILIVWRSVSRAERPRGLHVTERWEDGRRVTWQPLCSTHFATTEHLQGHLECTG